MSAHDAFRPDVQDGPAAAPFAARAEQALRAELAAAWAEAARYRACFELSGSGQAMVSLDGIMQNVNRRLCEILGRPAEDIVGRHFQEVTHPDDRDDDLSQFTALLAGRIRHYQLDKRYVRGDGQVVWCTLTVSLRSDAQGQPLELISVIDDIDERRRINEELRASEAMLQEVGRHLPSALTVYKRYPDGRDGTAYSSPRLRELFEIGPDDPRNPTDIVRELIAHELRPALDQEVRRSAHTMTEMQLDFPVTLPSSGERWMTVRSSPRRESDGSMAWYGVVTDITDRKLTERRLRERDTLLSSLGRNMPGAIYKLTAGPEGQPLLKYISERAADLYELVPDQLNKDWALHYTRVHPDDLPAVRRMGIDAMKPDATLAPVRYEYRVLLPRKGLRWLGGQAEPQQEPDGSIAWYGYTADITEHKLYQDALVSAEAAESANRAKSEFLSRMSHELRTPLNAVIGFAQLLRMDRSHPLDTEQRQRVDLIEQAGAHLLAMIGDVLDLSRIEAGSLPLSMEAVQLDRLARDATSLISEAARGSDIQLLPPDVHPALHVWADLVRLRQVLVNLLSNAVKYNRPGGTVQVRAWPEGTQVRLSVTDTGVGLSPAQQQHLFEPFNRLGAESSAVEGTGIGLVIVRRLVELMQGQVSVVSQQGQGSTFTIELPLAQALPRLDEALVLPSASAPAAPGARTATLLYAEDNAVNVALVEQVVSLRPDWNLTVASSGRRALAMARELQPDLLLLDMHLGDMTGFEVANELDKDDALARIPRVALSADAMPDQMHAARLRGFQEYLTKPLDVLALLDCLDRQMASLPPA